MVGGEKIKRILKIGIFSVFVLAVAFIAAIATRPSGGVDIDDIFCIVSINGGTYVKNDRVFLKRGDDISIVPVFVIDGEFYSRAGMFTVEDTAISSKRPPKIDFCWYQINPKYKKDGYDNYTNAPKNQFNSYLEPIIYSYTAMEKSGELRLADIAVDGFGAYYIQAMPGSAVPENFGNPGAFFMESSALQVIYRSDDSFLGYLSELMRSPFILYPKKTVCGHQTDLLIGSDCAEFVIYGFRRLGVDIPYCGPRNIDQYLIPLSENDVILPGDILHYGSQVAVYYEDKGIIGKIDGDDILLQSYGSKPYFTTVDENAKLFGNFRVFRLSD